MYQEAALAGFGGACVSRRNRFSPRKSRIGAAIKIEEDVPTTMPNNITQANPDNVAPPNRASGRGCG